MFTRHDNNRAWDVMQDELNCIRDTGIVDADNIEYHAQQLINAYVAGLCGQGAQSSHRTCYYNTTYTINNMSVTIRVANHRGHCDSSYKRVHGNTGIAAYDKSILAEPLRYIISIDVLKLRNERSRMRTITDVEDNITRIELININTQYLLEESLSFIDNELNDLF